MSPLRQRPYDAINQENHDRRKIHPPQRETDLRQMDDAHQRWRRTTDNLFNHFHKDGIFNNCSPNCFDLFAGSRI